MVRLQVRQRREQAQKSGYRLRVVIRDSNVGLAFLDWPVAVTLDLRSFYRTRCFQTRSFKKRIAAGGRWHDARHPSVMRDHCIAIPEIDGGQVACENLLRFYVVGLSTSSIPARGRIV